MDDLNDFQIALFQSDFALAKQLHDLNPAWQDTRVVGDRHWQHIAFWCEPDQLRFLHNDLGWDLDEDNSDEYNRTLITIFAYMDDMERVRTMYDLGYRVNLDHNTTPYRDGQIEPASPLKGLDNKYLVYVSHNSVSTCCNTLG
jgi:hypothetical protein